MSSRRVTVIIISFLFFLLWLYAGINKMMDPEFESQLMLSPYLERYSGFVEITLPWAEIIIAMILVVGMLLDDRILLFGLYVSFFLIFLFTAYIYSMLYYSHFTACSCGGILNKLSWNDHLIFNIGFTLLAILAILLIPNKNQQRHFWQKRSSSNLQIQTQ